MALRTAWTKPLDAHTPTTRDGGDPLGFRAYATRLTRHIAPGITQVTSTTRGFSVLCLGIEIVGNYARNEQEAREIFQRVERLWVAAQVHHPGDEEMFPGRRRAGQILDQLPSAEPYPLTKPLLTAQLSSGVWGGYRRAASAFGLISGAGRRSLRLSEVTLTSRGKDLIRHLRKGTLDGVNVGSWAPKDDVPLAILDKIRADRPVSKNEARVLTEGIESYDKFHEHSLGHLRSVFDREGSAISVQDLPGSVLSSRQRVAVPQAVALLEAIEQLEFRFRDWAATGNEPTWPKRLLNLPIWRLAGPGELDLANLHARINRAGDGAIGKAVLAHHQNLSAARGAAAWEPGSNLNIASQKVPDFALGALRSLFTEGVAPRVDS